jgi:MFS family permease
MRLRIYLDVLRVPSVTRLLSSAVVGRMPTGMAGLAIVLLVREAGASYAVAGMVAGTYSAALALSSPLLGRLVDRVGQTRVLVGCAVASALSFGALAAAGGFASPVALAGLAALAGASIPPVGACMRALWSELLGDHGQLQAAFAVESTVQELIFVIGPPLVALLAASFSPAAAVLGTAALLLLGVGVFAATPVSRAWRPQRRASDWAGPLRSPGVRAVLATIVLLAIACLYLLVDRLAPTGTVTEAFTWVTTAFSAGFAAGNALGGNLVQLAGSKGSFLVAAGGVAAAVGLARLRRPVLATAGSGMPAAPEGLGRAG